MPTRQSNRGEAMMWHRADGDIEGPGDFMRENRLPHGNF